MSLCSEPQQISVLELHMRTESDWKAFQWDPLISVLLSSGIIENNHCPSVCAGNDECQLVEGFKEKLLSNFNWHKIKKPVDTLLIYFTSWLLGALFDSLPTIIAVIMELIKTQRSAIDCFFLWPYSFKGDNELWTST